MNAGREFRRPGVRFTKVVGDGFPFPLINAATHRMDESKGQIGLVTLTDLRQVMLFDGVPQFRPLDQLRECILQTRPQGIDAFTVDGYPTPAQFDGLLVVALFERLLSQRRHGARLRIVRVELVENQFRGQPDTLGLGSGLPDLAHRIAGWRTHINTRKKQRGKGNAPSRPMLRYLRIEHCGTNHH